MRYKEYNVNRVLEKSMHLFWNNGYRACSIKDIVEETGVNRFSLYHEFENKEGILYGIMKLYRERYTQDKINILSENGEINGILSRFYLSFLDSENKNLGCFYIHVGTELADTDTNINKLLKSYLIEIEDLMILLFVKRDFPKEKAMFLARHLVGLFCTSMTFCLIMSESERKRHIENGITLILSKK